VWLPFVWGNAALFIQNTGDVASSVLSAGRRRRQGRRLPLEPTEADRERV